MTQQGYTETLKDLLGLYAAQVEADLEKWLIEPGTPEALAEAMRYCVMNGGKRLRPALVAMSAEAAGCNSPNQIVRRSALAVELVHGYSLVHDDLPAMDDDQLRRGRPTAHVLFGEAMAILAGDALLTRAMGILGECEGAIASRLVVELARGAGPAGMIAGQVADMELCAIADGPEGLEYIHSRKTAALIKAAARMGAVCAGASEEHLAAISDYGELLGLAFQVVDDILDVTGAAADLGKTPGKDVAANKRTHVALMGLSRTATLGRELTEKAALALRPLGENAEPLRRLAELLGERTH